MAVFTKMPLSGSTDGRNIAVAATATPGTTIHTATASSGVDSLDEVWVWAGSTSASAVQLGLTFGGGNQPGDQICSTVPVEYTGLTLVVPGLVMRNSTVLTATASAAGKVNLSGFVNRISQQSS